MKNHNKVALIAVDVQNDFCPGGSLAVEDGDKVTEPLNALRDWVLSKNGLYIATRDWHPAKTTHFDEWPPHCVAGTHGAEFHPALNVEGAVVVSKGLGDTEDAYSGFDAVDDSGKSLGTILETFSQGEKLALIIGGLATDFCVRATVLDAVGRKKTEVFVPTDATRAVNKEDYDGIIEEMIDYRAIICESEEIGNGSLIKLAKKEDIKMETLVVEPKKTELPAVEQKLTAGLDYYKPTMSQFAYEHAPDAEVTFTFKNRDTSRRLLDYVDPIRLKERLEDFQKRGIDCDEAAFLAAQSAASGESVFAEEYLDYLLRAELPEVDITRDENNDIAISTTGDWPMVSLWETVVMSELNEQYFEGLVDAKGLDIFELYEEGDRRLSQKIDLLKSRPDIKFIDFGTRRRFSARWHQYVLERLAKEVPDSLVGTSNVYFASKFGLNPVGTFAHELPMVYAGLNGENDEDLRASHNQLLNDWYDQYGEHLSIALTDTFTTKFFLEDFTKEQATAWKGVRHDSGDPFELGENIIKMYEDFGIDPMDKVIVFSDGLDIDKIVELQDYFGGRINLVYGWGTTLTNDLGPKALNIVMKATAVNGDPTVKLSDDIGKHTGPQAEVDRYDRVFVG